MIRLTHTNDEDAIDGLILLFSDGEIEQIKDKNAAFIDPEDGLPWLVVANEEDTKELEEKMEAENPMTLMDWLRRGLEKEWTHPRMAKRREDYERETVRPSPIPVIETLGGARSVEVAVGHLGTEGENDRIFITLGGGSLTNKVGYSILSKEHADRIIGNLISARNVLWPTP